MNYVRPMVARSVTCIVLARARRPSFLGLRCKTIEVPELQLMNADWSTWLISTTSEFQHPELSGIVVSLVDARGRQQDGFLRLYEIYNKRLGADLVVLSTCQTALGKEVRVEGLIGLTRGFMYAGSPRVVATLWSVKDEATAELMKRFYQGMIKRNMAPAAALRAAQVSMLHESRWSSPHYWAGFVIQVEWR